MADIKIGVVGGSGVYEMAGLVEIERIKVDTPFGAPSDDYVVGRLGAQRIAFLPRHGVGHRHSPAEVPYRANIYGFKSLGVERLISITAVGSMREDHAPLDIVIPDQLFDRTKLRANSFFGNGLVVHISFADPFCPELAAVVYEAAAKSGARTHRGGTLVVIDGPQFSTQAESKVNRALGMDLIGMTALPEAKLAREAEICYAAVAMVTDYDVWHPDHASVTVDMVVQNLLKNAETGKAIVRESVPNIPGQRGSCPCHNALETAIITRHDLIPDKTRRDLDLLVGKYLR